jgi:transcriptional regulator with XRE-family HTH domain
MLNNRVCTKIKLLRLEKNLTQVYLAEQLNISQSYYAKLESGKKEMSMKMFFEVLKILDVDIASFVNDLY